MPSGAAACESTGTPQLWGCSTTKPPRVCYCVASDLFAIKRGFRQQELAGSNAKFSRHAARKPMIARYRRMPRGRPAMTSCSLAQTELLRHRFWAAELLICGRRSFAIANLREILDCAAATELLQLSKTIGLQSFQNSGPKQLHDCQPATDFGLRDDNQTIANLRKILIRVLCRANKPPQVRYCAASD